MANAQPLGLVCIDTLSTAAAGKVQRCGHITAASQFEEATNTCKAISELGFKNRGIKDGSKLYVVHHSDAKAMLVEVCFVDTDDARKIYKRLVRHEFAKAIYQRNNRTNSKARI